jgi:small-conductance mechanosensitive channel
MTRPTLARAAVALISAFPLLVLVLHGVQAGRYHPLSQAVSELALGRDGWLMAIAFCSLGTGTLFLAAMLRRLDAPPRVAPWLIGVSGVLSYVSAFVHADGPHSTTTNGQIHQAVGIVTFVLMITGMFALIRPFRRDRRFRRLAAPTLVWGFAAVGGFFLIPLSGAAYFGVAQRIFLTIILSWALTVSARGIEAPAREPAVAPAG